MGWNNPTPFGDAKRALAKARREVAGEMDDLRTRLSLAEQGWELSRQMLKLDQAALRASEERRQAMREELVRLRGIDSPERRYVHLSWVEIGALGTGDKFLFPRADGTTHPGQCLTRESTPLSHLVSVTYREGWGGVYAAVYRVPGDTLVLAGPETELRKALKV